MYQTSRFSGTFFSSVSAAASAGTNWLVSIRPRIRSTSASTGDRVGLSAAASMGASERKGGHVARLGSVFQSIIGLRSGLFRASELVAEPETDRAGYADRLRLGHELAVGVVQLRPRVAQIGAVDLRHPGIL